LVITKKYCILSICIKIIYNFFTVDNSQQFEPNDFQLFHSKHLTAAFSQQTSDSSFFTAHSWTKRTLNVNAAPILQMYSIHFCFLFHNFFLQQFAKQTYALNSANIFHPFLCPMPQFFPAAIQSFNCNLTWWKVLL
jgi:hypothetical protein